MLHTSTASRINEHDLPTAALAAVEVDRLTDSDAAEVLQFLAQRPFHTVTMASLIQDNRVVSYRKCGFHFRATYETIFLPRKEQVQN